MNKLDNYLTNLYESLPANRKPIAAWSIIYIAFTGMFIFAMQNGSDITMSKGEQFLRNLTCSNGSLPSYKSPHQLMRDSYMNELRS